MPIVAQDSEARLEALIRNGAGQPAAAPDLELTLVDAGDVVVAGFPVLIPPIVNDALGSYHYVWTVPIGQPEGLYTAYWTGTVAGQPITGQEDWEVVAGGTITPGTGQPLHIMRKPEDYESVRRVLGVTKLDVPDERIEDLVFGQEAERRTVAALGGQEATDVFLGNPADAKVVRLACVYATAALLLEQNRDGGWLGYTGHERVEPQDPSDLWDRWQSYVGSLVPPGTVSGTAIAIDGLIVTGPSRAALNASPLGLYHTWHPNHH